jgi:hypothetical protein
MVKKMIKNRRRKNKVDMTITEQLEALREDICDNYCKFPGEVRSKYTDIDKATEQLVLEHCDGCPFMELM